MKLCERMLFTMHSDEHGRRIGIDEETGWKQYLRKLRRHVGSEIGNNDWAFLTNNISGIDINYYENHCLTEYAQEVSAFTSY